MSDRQRLKEQWQTAVSAMAPIEDLRDHRTVRGILTSDGTVRRGAVEQGMSTMHWYISGNPVIGSSQYGQYLMPDNARVRGLVMLVKNVGGGTTSIRVRAGGVTLGTLTGSGQRTALGLDTEVFGGALIELDVLQNGGAGVSVQLNYQAAEVET